MRTGMVAFVVMGWGLLASAEETPLSGCSAGELDARSYRLVTRAQALNLHRPRYDWWDGFDLGRHEAVLDDMMGSATTLAERALEIDPRNVMAQSHLARLYLVHEDPERAERHWQRVLDAGGAVVWTGTLYDVDARTYFVLAFDRAGIRIYQFAQLARPMTRGFYGIPEFPPADQDRFWEAMGGCIDPEVVPQARIPWSDVSEIKAGNWVLWFKLLRPVTIASDRNGKRKTLDEVKVALHGRTGELEAYKPVGEDHLALRGRGPTGYNDLVRRTMVKFVDPERRISMPPSRPGVGW